MAIIAIYQVTGSVRHHTAKPSDGSSAYHLPLERDQAVSLLLGSVEPKMGLLFKGDFHTDRVAMGYTWLDRYRIILSIRMLSQWLNANQGSTETSQTLKLQIPRILEHPRDLDDALGS